MSDKVERPGIWKRSAEDAVDNKDVNKKRKETSLPTPQKRRKEASPAKPAYVRLQGSSGQTRLVFVPVNKTV